MSDFAQTGLPTANGMLLVDPTIAPLGNGNGGFTGTLPAVNPAQVPNTIPSSPPQSPGSNNGMFPLSSGLAQTGGQPGIPQSFSAPSDTSALIVQYESRLRELMSQKDRAIYERNQAITAQTELQRQLMGLQDTSSQALAGAAGSTQSAIDENRRLAVRLQQVEGELLRANTLLDKPHLAQYRDFLPTQGTAEEVNAAIAKLEGIRAADLARMQPASPPPVAGGVPAPAPAPIAGANPYAALYGNRPGMAPGVLATAPAPMPAAVAVASPPLVPGSSPAMMSPVGTGSTEMTIAQMLATARATGDPAQFNAAVRQASELAQQAIGAQLGRS